MCTSFAVYSNEPVYGMNIDHPDRHTSEYFQTVCSMVFDPVRLQVYLVLSGEFQRIWRISIMEDIIESYSGFRGTHKFKVGAKGILASELELCM